MKTVTSLITPELLEESATRSHYRYGKDIAKNGNISLEMPNSFNITASVKHKGAETRTVEVSSTPKGLRWKCTCSARKDLFCQHCVAAGLYILKQQKSTER